MKKGMKFVWMVFLLALILPAYASAAEEEGDIREYVDHMQPGWNLGNTFDAVGLDETAWGNPQVTKELIEKIGEQGYKSIRIPITFDQRMEGAPDYTIQEDFLDRVTQAVQWSLDEGLYVMINVHHDSWIWLESGMPQDHDQSLARFDAIWTQLANHFKEYPRELMFESINEPRFHASLEESQQHLNELNDHFYEIVRGSGGLNETRPLVLPTLDTGSEPEKMNPLYDYIVGLDDPYIIATMHYYGFWPFSVNIAGYTQFEEDTKNDIIQTFDRIHDKFVANGIPVVIGEFGLLGFDTDIGAVQQGEKLKFFEYMIHYAQEKRLTHMLWDNGQHLNRHTYEWSDPELFAMMKASWDGRSSTAESDFIYLKKDEVVRDVEKKLHLHGNEFVSLQLAGQDLIVGQDYEMSGDVLTVKKELLSSLMGDLGVNSTLTATFNQGKPWKFDVITYDTPLLEDKSGTVHDFKIPTIFNGDQLATMEAVYAEGGNAGPQDWTSFKEFAYTFSPLYDSHEIELKKNFFNDVHDGEILLTFYFWSG